MAIRLAFRRPRRLPGASRAARQAESSAEWTFSKGPDRSLDGSRHPTQATPVLRTTAISGILLSGFWQIGARRFSELIFRGDAAGALLGLRPQFRGAESSHALEGNQRRLHPQ